MKKLIILVSVFLFVVSCSDDVGTREVSPSLKKFQEQARTIKIKGLNDVDEIQQAPKEKKTPTLKEFSEHARTIKIKGLN